MNLSKQSSSMKYHIHFFSNHRNRQKGVVLIVSLIFLIALTAVASALMLNSTTDMKMSGASEVQVVANQEAFGAVDELIFRQVNPAAGQVNNFSQPIVTYQDDNQGARDVLFTLTDSNSNGDITGATVDIINNEYMVETACPRTKNANSAQLESCNVLQVQLTKVYGRKNNSTVEVNAGITQKLGKL